MSFTYSRGTVNKERIHKIGGVNLVIILVRYRKGGGVVQEVKKAMKALEPMILPYGSQTPSYYDDSVKAHMISIEYKNYKKKL